MKSIVNFVRTISKDRNRKSYLKIIKECIHYSILKKESPVDYFRKFLYRKSIYNYTDHLSLRQYYSIIDSPNIYIEEYASIINNKIDFSHFCQNNNLPIPMLICFNRKNQFYYNSDEIIIDNGDELLEFYKSIFHKLKVSSLFIKPSRSHGGIGAILLKKENLKKQIIDNAEIILNNDYVHQEVVVNHFDIIKINPNSLNTLRIDTYIDELNNAHNLSALMRFGLGNSITDNTSGGNGFYVSVDLKSGELSGKGIQEFNGGAKVFTKHPDTGFILYGFKIPYLNEALDLTKKVSLLIPNKIIGWDIAITANGPLIIEGNTKASLHMTDVAYGGYCRHPKIREILNYVKK